MTQSDPTHSSVTSAFSTLVQLLDGRSYQIMGRFLEGMCILKMSVHGCPCLVSVIGE
jgi:hypothetical protein